MCGMPIDGRFLGRVSFWIPSGYKPMRWNILSDKVGKNEIWFWSFGFVGPVGKEKFTALNDKKSKLPSNGEQQMKNQLSIPSKLIS